MKKYIFVLLTLISFLGHAQYQAEQFEAALLEAKYGALLIYNGQLNSFSIKFESNSVRPTEHPNVIGIDNILLQASITPFTQKLDFANLDNQAMKRHLTSWKSYEKKWVEEQLGIKLTEKEEFIDIADKPFLYWRYNMPESNEKASVEKQVYLVTICFDQILTLSGPVEKGKSEQAIKDKFLTVAKTLKLYANQTQDLKKLYYELKK